MIGDAWAGLVASEADQLGGYRIAELCAALSALGSAAPRFLAGAGRYRDSGMIGTPSAANPRAFVNARLDEAVGAVVAVIREIRPHVVITYDPQRRLRAPGSHPGARDHDSGRRSCRNAPRIRDRRAVVDSEVLLDRDRAQRTRTRHRGDFRVPGELASARARGIAERRGHRRDDGNRRSRRHRCEGEGIERPRHSGDGSPEPSRVRIVEQRGPTDPDGRAFRIGRRRARSGG